jgi:hypothetical protein
MIRNSGKKGEKISIKETRLTSKELYLKPVLMK